ncbi:hypothetical protein SVA_3096 [Sulfurifustis variabilis]|uniref:Uncharacterized protein n=1 Tax=Sulfurifustis variabilis TaxID=1675686 RepID=A0A1B4VBF3_9GAMM|nr:hypothetical protein [Sulfurifustis variabilis]BAU49644.1 hypothetical protein SVA_3096 [Sulfurifustis variabilis]
MPYTTVHHISPSHTHEKLESPSYSDLVDVFEDRMRKWLLEPALHLLTLEHGDAPAVSLVLGYFEGIEIYCSGKDSKGASKESFRRGFQRVFRTKPENSHLYDEIVDSLYVQARCGFVHDGLFRNRVFFSDARPEALNVTWPRKDGEFVKDGHLESVVINAARFVDGVVVHFNSYISDLRAESDPDLKANFLAAVELKWGLNEPDRVIGMSESEFFSNGA